MSPKIFAKKSATEQSVPEDARIRMVDAIERSTVAAPWSEEVGEVPVKNARWKIQVMKEKMLLGSPTIPCRVRHFNVVCLVFRRV